MNEHLSRQALWVAALICFVVGTAMTIQTVRQEKQSAAKLERKRNDMGSLLAIEHEFKRGSDAVEAFEQMGWKKPAQITELMKDTVPGLKPEEIKDVRRETVAGWAVRQKEITLSDIELGKLMDFLVKAESQRPPWRTVKLAIRSSPRSPGIARVEFSMEALEKTQ